jgi:glucokinase
LADDLHKTYGRACWEDLVSGPGLVTLYRFLLQQQGSAEPAWLAESENPAATVAAQADEGGDEIAIQAMEQFVRMYGAEAGNLALKQMATGGLYVGGGIAPKILLWLQQPAFLQAFCAKGKMQGLMESIPVRVILNDRVALYGAARFARSKP